MLARISTVLDCTEKRFWDRIIRPESLQFVASPLLHFEPLVAGDLNGEWIVGKTYVVRLSSFGFLPLGQHRIKIVTIDRATNTIESQEGGSLARVWNHTMRFYPIGAGRLRYTDEIEIKAGLLTAFIWAFAHLFYRHRQRRWKELLKRHIN
ncbi:MAG: hypothetical protein JXR84_03650 [Anaerolineae bacterium]|nr:hypothetical protein [Anaerolineae bacterium]